MSVTMNTLPSGTWRCVVWYISTNVVKEHAVRIFEVLMYREDGGDCRFVRNVGNHLPDYTASHPRDSDHIDVKTSDLK
jgi:hypothetical protein